jgi:acetylglutamate/LysW-gamma-L-alpha-aminoadipate kinase
LGTTVVKCGGNDAIDPDQLCADIAAIRANGEQVVLVHGGAADIARLADELGVEARTLRSPGGIVSRYTDPAMLDVVTLALIGRAKPRLLAALSRLRVPAVGLTGLDAGLLRAVRKPARRSVTDDGRVQLIRDDQSGRIVSVDPTVVCTLLDAGIVPVVSPPAIGEDGAALNVDADRAAAALAGALGADRLVLLTAAPGLLRDVDDSTSLLTRFALPPDGSLDQVQHAASGGMHRKLVAAREALLGGVPVVRIADGRTAGSVSAALSGAGTQIDLAAESRSA